MKPHPKASLALSQAGEVSGGTGDLATQSGQLAKYQAVLGTLPPSPASITLNKGLSASVVNARARHYIINFGRISSQVDLRVSADTKEVHVKNASEVQLPG